MRFDSWLLLIPSSSLRCDRCGWPGGLELGEGVRGSPFVEGSGPLLPEHGKGTVASAAVLTQGRVHVSRLDHVDRGGNDGGTEARAKGRGEVTREVI